MGSGRKKQHLQNTPKQPYRPQNTRQTEQQQEPLQLARLLEERARLRQQLSQLTGASLAQLMASHFRSPPAHNPEPQQLAATQVAFFSPHTPTGPRRPHMGFSMPEQAVWHARPGLRGPPTGPSGTPYSPSAGPMPLRMPSDVSSSTRVQQHSPVLPIPNPYPPIHQLEVTPTSMGSQQPVKRSTRQVAKAGKSAKKRKLVLPAPMAEPPPHQAGPPQPHAGWDAGRQTSWEHTAERHYQTGWLPSIAHQGPKQGPSNMIPTPQGPTQGPLAMPQHHARQPQDMTPQIVPTQTHGKRTERASPYQADQTGNAQWESTGTTPVGVVFGASFDGPDLLGIQLDPQDDLFAGLDILDIPVDGL